MVSSSDRLAANENGWISSNSLSNISVCIFFIMDDLYVCRYSACNLVCPLVLFRVLLAMLSLCLLLFEFLWIRESCPTRGCGVIDSFPVRFVIRRLWDVFESCPTPTCLVRGSPVRFPVSVLLSLLDSRLEPSRDLSLSLVFLFVDCSFSCFIIWVFSCHAWVSLMSGFVFTVSNLSSNLT